MSNPLPTDRVTVPSSYVPRTGSVNDRILDLLRREPDRLHSYRTIAGDVGTTPASVQTRLGGLRRRGRIEKLQSVHGPGGGSQYRVLATIAALQKIAAE